MKTCRRCLLTSRASYIAFDAADRCNFCRTYDELKPQLRDFGRMQSLWKERIEGVRGGLRGQSPYDCLVGLSGGKDSSYVAYRLCREMGLRVLLFTYDNGFLSPHAQKNVERVVKTLGADHFWLRPEPDLHRAIYRGSIRRFGVPCPGCTFPAMAHVIKVAVDKRIPLLIHGRSRAQMFKELVDGTFDVFLHLVFGNFQHYNRKANRELMLNLGKRINGFTRSLLPESNLRSRASELFVDLKELGSLDHAPELLGLFLFEPYDEERIKSVLQQKLGWQRPPEDDLLGHEDCLAHPAVVNLYTQVFGQPMMAQELSVLIREGDMTRAQALERLGREPNIKEIAKEPLAQLTLKTGWTEAELLRQVAKARRMIALFKSALRMGYKVLPRKKLQLRKSLDT